MAYTLGNKYAKNLCKWIVLLQLIIENVVTCFFWNTVYIHGVTKSIQTFCLHEKLTEIRLLKLFQLHFSYELRTVLKENTNYYHDYNFLTHLSVAYFGSKSLLALMYTL